MLDYLPFFLPAVFLNELLNNLQLTSPRGKLHLAKVYLHSNFSQYPGDKTLQQESEQMYW